MQPMKKSKVLIIGGAGFIGGNLTISLLKAGYDVRVFTRSSRSVKNISKYLDKIELIFGDFMDDFALKSAVKGVDKVIHLVSTTFPGTKSDSNVYDIYSNLIPTVRLLEICRELSIKNIVYASSGGTIYGEPIYNPIDEDHPLKPKSLYGHSKKIIESYLTFFSENFGINIQILRISNPYGPFQNIYGTQGLIAVAFGSLMENRTFTVFGKGDIVRDYIYIDDVMDAFKSALTSEKSNLVNISSGQGKSILEILDKIQEVTGRKIQIIKKDERKGDVKVNVLSNEHAKKVYGWSPQSCLDLGISNTWDWIKTLRF